MQEHIDGDALATQLAQLHDLGVASTPRCLTKESLPSFDDLCLEDNQSIE
jgi:hypothetical protein